jgi:hypothetical protein
MLVWQRIKRYWDKELMLRAKEIFLYSRISLALTNANGIPFLAGGLDSIALRNGFTGNSSNSLQPVYFPLVIILSKSE